MATRMVFFDPTIDCDVVIMLPQLERMQRILAQHGIEASLRDIYQAWSNWSESTYCASFMTIEDLSDESVYISLSDCNWALAENPTEECYLFDVATS